MSVARCHPRSISLLPLPLPLKLKLTGTAALTLVALSLGATRSLAGPHAHGALIVHWNEQLVYTDGVDYCGLSALSACADAVTPR